MNTALRRAGFDKVFDTNFTADLTIIEEGTELILRLYKALVEKDASVALPQFTSCSPGWVKYLEHFYPEYLPNLSTPRARSRCSARSSRPTTPRSSGSTRRTSSACALMPCSAKKFECNRPEMHDSAASRTSTSASPPASSARCSRRPASHVPSLPKCDFDDPFGTATGSGVIFGATGGVMEAALRTVIELVTGEKVESIYEHGDIIPVRGFEGVQATPRSPIPQGRPGARDPRAPRARLGLAQGRHAQGRRGPRHRQRQEGHGRHQGRRQVQRVPLHRVHGLPGRLPGRRRPADPDQRRRSARRAPRPSTPRTRPTTCASRTRTRPCSQIYARVPHRRPVRPQEPRAAAHPLHGARQAHPAGAERTADRAEPPRAARRADHIGRPG